MPSHSVPNSFIAVTFDGLASDAELSRLDAATLLSVRVVIETDDCAAGCKGGHEPGQAFRIVGLSGEDVCLSSELRTVVRELPAGHALVDRGHAELVGGTIAVPGVDILVAAAVDVQAPLLIVTMADIARFVVASGDHELVMRTVAILASGGTQDLPSGWRRDTDLRTSLLTAEMQSVA